MQGGILAGYENADRACLILLAFDSREAAGRFLEHLRPQITTARVVPEAGVHAQAGGLLKESGDGPFCNVAFTHEGLRVLGMTETELESWLPHEFREGMEARSSMLGDFRANHPRRWSLPRMNWFPDGVSSAIETQMSAVHAIVQIRVAEGALPPAGKDESGEQQELELLRPLIERAIGVSEATGDASKGSNAASEPRAAVRVLHVQTMRRRRNDDARVTEHFGFVDGDGQPQFVPTGSKAYPNQVPVGEVLLGYPNQADFAPRPRNQDDEARLDFLRNGTFMVVRKLRQDVGRLDAVIRQAAADTGLDPRLILAKMMGRWQSGPSLVSPADFQNASRPEPDTDFTFDGDPHGSGCPFHAHVRRVNPRSRPRKGDQPGARLPRILRRGMAYGPRPAAYPGAGSQAAGDDADRGLVFIAYNASIAEQFEVVQSWIAGGNSSGGYSGCSDPFLGVPEPGQQRWFSFEADAPAKSDGAGQRETADCADGKRVFHIKLDSGPGQFEEPAPLVRLQWGSYLFVPSLHTLDWLSRRALAPPAFVAPWNVADGERAVQSLLARWGQDPAPEAVAAWKAAVEDTGSREQMLNASLWAAVRERHGGALQTPYGVLVGSRRLVREVLGDDVRFSVCGQRERMERSRFEIYLGLDSGERYQRLSEPINRAIGSISEEDAFEQAAAACSSALRTFIDGERAVGLATSGKRWELNLEAREVFDLVLQRLCQLWIGLPATGGPLQPGSWRWDWHEGEPPIYPSHFTPPSRYFFQPRPGDDVRDFGERHGRSITAALEEFVAFHRRRGTVPHVPDQAQAAPLAEQIFAAMPASQADDATLARTLAGVLMGFLPTLDGSLRSVLHEWLRLQTFWSLRTQWAADAAPSSIDKARRILGPALCRALQFRPAPEIIWRTVRRDDDRIGDVAVRRGDIVVLGLVSAMHERLAGGDDDVHAMFGGDRAQDPHPTHACPGYKAAMGVLLGVFAALMDVKEVMRPSPASLAFTLEGALP
ncbi:hypothetical protein [Piscinibacter koreensis]|uniref:Dyp-type peroxidase family n=1 Tax=Piscinibacter koreensis TaxID=2742824 RepID=A0A7Y6TWC4_9BURK|nr:hypothetical protein [Schlegelella koreensis]NUZ05898.1 hypothetical protein [Schlegelella koreensis]